MIEMTCIVCPNSCRLKAEKTEEGITVTGNKCKRGEEFARAELTNPVRTLCSTVKTAFPDVPVLPVRVNAEIPKNKIFDVMAEIDKITVKQRITRGEVIIKNVLGLGADVIATSSVLTNMAEKQTKENAYVKTV